MIFESQVIRQVSKSANLAVYFWDTLPKEARNSFFRRFEQTGICGLEGTDRLIYIWMLNGHRM